MSSRFSLHRRTFIKGSGVALGLPLLECMIPRQKANAASISPQRLIAIYMPLGAPQASKNHPAMDPALQERLKPILNDCTIVTNISNQEILSKQYQLVGSLNSVKPTPHGSAFPGMMAGAPINFTTDNAQRTWDQHIALLPKFKAAGDPSVSILLLKMNDGKIGPPIIFNTFSWKGPMQPVDPFFDPRPLFDKLFAKVPASPGGPAPNPAPTGTNNRKLVLDYLLRDTKRIKALLGKEDIFRVDEYLTRVEELDRRTTSFDQTTGQLAAECRKPGVPAAQAVTQANSGSRYPELMTLMQDLMIATIQCDLSRVFTMMHSPENNGREDIVTSFVKGLEGGPSIQHKMSHWASPTTGPSGGSDIPRDKRDFTRVISWHYDQVVRLASQLKALKNPDGTSLLDSTLITWGSGLGWGSTHQASALHQTLIGGGGGAFLKGKRIDAGGVPIANLWLTIMKGFGVQATKLGNSTGTIAGITA